MLFYCNHIYPRLVSKLGDPKPIREIRQRILPWAQGTILEIGVGPGVNFAHYNPARITKVFALEPNSGMIRLAERQRGKTTLEIKFLDAPGERIPLGYDRRYRRQHLYALHNSGVVEALGEIRRVLKPGGQLIFFEHGLSPDSKVQRWQHWYEPINRRLFQGCHLTRDIPSLLERCGFTIQQVEAAYIADFPKPWTYCWWGTAISKFQEAFSAHQL